MQKQAENKYGTDTHFALDLHDPFMRIYYLFYY
jgi:hypothetical protein